MKGCVLVDVGNTSTTIGFGAGRRIMRVKHLKGGIGGVRRARTIVRDVIGGDSATGAVVASVVPGSTPAWVELLEGTTGAPPLVVSHRTPLGITIDYPKPETIGADRLANSVGAVARYGSPVIVADFGTALTFDIVQRGAAYIGGVIAPGLPLMTDYLAERTALLPHIRLGGTHGDVGRSTAGAMRIGAHVGYRGMVREIVNYLEDRLDIPDARLCATGGFARWALTGIDLPFEFDPNLTLRGLARIYQWNL